MASLALALASSATPLRVESALFDPMLLGWRRQQRSRRLGGSLIDRREQTVRRFSEFAPGWPWTWRAEQLERWVADSGWAHSTVRNYQGVVGACCAYAIDPRYGWVAECEQQVGARPSQICHSDNTGAHVADYEGRPERRPLSRLPPTRSADRRSGMTTASSTVTARPRGGPITGEQVVPCSWRATSGP